MIPIFIVTPHPMLPKSQGSTNAQSPLKDTLFLVLFNDLDRSTGRFHTFPNFGNYNEFSFPLKGGTMIPQDIRVYVYFLLLSHLHFHPIEF
jgi:hypothetical protein